MSIEIDETSIYKKPHGNRKYKDDSTRLKHNSELKKKYYYEKKLELEKDEFVKKLIKIRLENINKRLKELELLC